MEPVIGTFLATSEQLFSFDTSDDVFGDQKRYALKISDEQAVHLKSAGWNVKTYGVDEVKCILLPRLNAESSLDIGPYLDQAVESDDDSWELEICGYAWTVGQRSGVMARLVRITNKGV